ncbi:MAG: hypothetical protein V1817_02720 [Candidatus Micrarchaeota archaeon]
MSFFPFIPLLNFANAFSPVMLDGFGDAFGFVVLIIVFLMLYRLFYPDMVQNKAVALVIVVIITVLVVYPYPWFMYFLFVVLFMYAVFWTFKPYRW